METFFDTWHGNMLIGVLLVLLSVEVCSLFVGGPLQNVFKQGPSSEKVLRISEIDGPFIDAVAAGTMVTETLPSGWWFFLLVAYMALLVFNFSYTFETVTAPQWFWEMVYTCLALFCWYVFDQESIHLWFPFMILKSGLIILALYWYLLEKRLFGQVHSVVSV